MSVTLHTSLTVLPVASADRLRAESIEQGHFGPAGNAPCESWESEFGQSNWKNKN
jgi:hypothetical protein